MRWVEELRALLRRLGGQEPATPPGGIECHEALARIFEWLDHEIDPAEEARVGEHLQTCAMCYPVLQFERSFREAMTHARTAESAASPELRAQVLHALEGEGFEPS